MGFYVRQSVSAGPFRFTFSNAGIGVSAGMKGLRVGTGPRGSYVRVGSGGLSYRMSLNGTAPRAPAAPRQRFAPPAQHQHGTFTPVVSGDVMRMADASSAALLAEIQARHRRARGAPWAAALSAFVLLVAIGNGAPGWLAAVLLAAGCAATVLTAQRDAAARTMVLMYELEPFAETAYERLHQAFGAMGGAQRAWSVRGRAGVWDQKRNAGATSLVQRQPVHLSTGAPPVVKSNLVVPVIPAGHETLYLFPDRILVFTPGGVGAVPYQALRVDVAPTRFIEEGPVPRDARVVDHTWRYVNKGGGPDRRFRDNPQIPVVLYEELGLTSGTGLQVVLQLSRTGGGEAFRSAVTAMAALPSNVVPSSAPATTPSSAAPPVDAPAPSPTRPTAMDPPTSFRIGEPAVSRPAAELASSESAPTPERAADAAPARAHAPAPAAPRVAWRWVPPGVPVEVGGYVVPGGMIYAGAGLRAVAEWRGAEPALVDPRLPVANDPREVATASAGYWPSYSEVSPGFRARYLRWLAGGRSDPGIDAGCVFLFFYGIERRLLVDFEAGAVTDAEAEALVGEVERLLGIYGDQGSFQRYATAFLDLARVRHGMVDLDPAAPPEENDGYDLPLPLRVKLGRLAAAGERVPAEWALAWARQSPLIPLRTAAARCPDEFDAAFRNLYRARFGDGMRVKPNRTKVAVSYQPASASFSGNTVRLNVGDVPDVGALKGPTDRLAQVAETAAAAIDRYSRWVGRTGEGDSLPALALLPREVLRRRVRRSTPPLLAEVAAALRPHGIGTVPSSLLLRHWPAARADRLSKREAESLGDFLEKLGLGIAPDVRHTGINPTQGAHAAVFLLPGEAPAPGPDFAAATLLLTLGAAVAGADELARAEEEEIERHLETAYRLNDADRARLRAHLAWLRACPPSTAGMKKQLEPLPLAERERIARALIAIAGADGHVSPAEVKMLTRVYPLLGLDAARVFADVHALAAGHGPVTVIPADPAQEFAIPAPARGAPRRPSGFVLDVARIASIQRETHEVTRVLASVFAGEEPADAAGGRAVAAAASIPETGGEEDDARPSADACLPGLDAAHTALVRVLGDRAEIAAAELAALAEAHGLMAGGAMETINDAAFQLCDEPLLEGADPIQINPFAREELFK
jgi:uncharacterized tellurite resistance protein B-like protein